MVTEQAPPVGLAPTGTSTSIAAPASRTLRRPLNALPQLCVWDAVVCSEFSLADRLPSAPSADDELPSLFEHFAGTTRSSDSLPTFMLGLWLITFSSRPVHYFVSGIGRASRFSRVEFPGMQGSSTSQSPTNARAFASVGVAFRTEYGVGTLISVHFAAPYPARLCHCQRFARNLTVLTRMTRGRCGSLGLHRMTLSFTPPRRFNPAHTQLDSTPHRRRRRADGQTDEK